MELGGDVRRHPRGCRDYRPPRAGGVNAFKVIEMGIQPLGEAAALLESEERVRKYRKGRRFEGAVEKEASADAVNMIPLGGEVTEGVTARVDRAIKRRLREGLEDRALGARNTRRRRGKRRLHKGQLR